MFHLIHDSNHESLEKLLETSKYEQRVLDEALCSSLFLRERNCTRLLLQYGADPNYEDDGNPIIFEYYWSDIYGAYINIINQEGESLRDILRMNRYYKDGPDESDSDDSCFQQSIDWDIVSSYEYICEKLAKRRFSLQERQRYRLCISLHCSVCKLFDSFSPTA